MALTCDENSAATTSEPIQKPGPRHEDRIETLDTIFYLRWTSGPNYERVFLCIEDGEPDMQDIATMTFKQARKFAATYRFAKAFPLKA